MLMVLRQTDSVPKQLHRPPKFNRPGRPCNFLKACEPWAKGSKYLVVRKRNGAIALTECLLQRSLKKTFLKNQKTHVVSCVFNILSGLSHIFIQKNRIDVCMYTSHEALFFSKFLELFLVHFIQKSRPDRTCHIFSMTLTRNLQ